MKTKNEIYVVVDTPKKAKKLQKVLDMFGEKTFEKEYKVSFNDCIGNAVHFWGGRIWTVCTENYTPSGKQKVSIKELRNILAVEHLTEGDVVVLGIGIAEYVAKYKIFDGNYFESIDYYMIGSSGKTHGCGCFDNFIRYATEEERSLLEPKEEKKELEVGKWYKYPEYPKFLSIHTNNGNRYGFDINGLWFNADDSLLGCSGYVEATAEEVKQALIHEAEKLGLVDGAVYNNSNIHGFNVGNNLIDDFGGYEFNVEKNELRVLDKNEVDTWYTIFKNGKWAEVLPQTNTQTQITDKDIATLERLHDTLHDVHGYSLEFELMKSARVLADKLRELNAKIK